MERLFFLVGALAFGTAQCVAQISNINSVAWATIPPAVQSAILNQANNVAMPTVESGIQNGRLVYSVDVPQTDGTKKIVLDANGTVLLDQPAATLPVVAPAPETVVSTNALPEGVTREVVGGRTTYNIESENSQIRVGTEGRVLSATTPGGTQMSKISWQSIPPVIQNVIREQSGPGRILELTRGTYNERSVYEVIYEQNTQRTRLRLLDNGDVLGQSVIDTEDRSSVPVEPYIGVQQVPVAVMTALQAAAGANPIESVQQEVVDGVISYVGMFRENGQPVSLRISQTGQILK